MAAFLLGCLHWRLLFECSLHWYKGKRRRVLLGFICPGCYFFPAFVKLASAYSLPLILQRTDGPKGFLCSWGIVSPIFWMVLLLSCGLMEMAFGPSLLAVCCLSKEVHHMSWVVPEWKRLNHEKHVQYKACCVDAVINGLMYNWNYL